MKTAVVFIHGFTGGESTWRNDAGISFWEMLEVDPGLSPAFDFFQFEYFTKLSDLPNTALVQKVANWIRYARGFTQATGNVKQNQPIANLSQQLTTDLRLRLRDYSEVILIAHSMGGLIAKDHIINYQPGNGPKPVAYISMAVPHKGALKALLLAPASNINAKELVPLSKYSDELNNKWVDHKKDLPQTLYMIAQHDECVLQQSATPFTVTGPQRAVVDHSHSSICKPNSTSDGSFLAVSQFLKDFAYQKSMAALASATATTPDYDKEIFVLKMMVCDIGPMGITDAKDCFFQAEVISKAANRSDAEEMRVLQQKVLSIYKQKYNEFFGTAHVPNHVFSQIHSEIVNQDKHALKSSVEYLNFLHKKGLLHQMANGMNKTVIWSDAADYFDKIEKAM